MKLFTSRWAFSMAFAASAHFNDEDDIVRVQDDYARK